MVDKLPNHGLNKVYIWPYDIITCWSSKLFLTNLPTFDFVRSIDSSLKA